jgi:hypothetical protein
MRSPDQDRRRESAEWLRLDPGIVGWPAPIVMGKAHDPGSWTFRASRRSGWKNRAGPGLPIGRSSGLKQAWPDPLVPAEANCEDRAKSFPQQAPEAEPAPCHVLGRPAIRRRR